MSPGSKQNLLIAGVIGSLLVGIALMIFSVDVDELVEVRGDTLYVQSSYLTESIPIQLVQVDSVRLVDLSTEQSALPKTRIIGSSLKIHGLYELSNTRKAFVYLKGEGDVVYVPVKNRMDVLVRKLDAAGFIDALKKAANTANPGRIPLGEDRAVSARYIQPERWVLATKHDHC